MAYLGRPYERNHPAWHAIKARYGKAIYGGDNGSGHVFAFSDELDNLARGLTRTVREATIARGYRPRGEGGHFDGLAALQTPHNQLVTGDGPETW